MDLGLTGRVAAVCAASKGLGRASAEALAREGCDVAICARGEEALRATAKEIEGLGARAHPVALDLPQPGAAERFIEETVATFGRIDVLVGNVGGPRASLFEGTTDQEFRDVLEQNLMVMVRLARAALPHMRAQHWGRIIFITSISAKQPIDYLMTGNTARAGVTGFAKTLSREVARDGITVNTVLPENVLTDRIRELAGAGADDPAAWQHVPAGRAGRPDELGALVAFLASEQASYINGTAIAVDGGSARSLL